MDRCAFFSELFQADAYSTAPEALRMLGMCFLESININLDAQKKSDGKYIFFLEKSSSNIFFAKQFSTFLVMKITQNPQGNTLIHTVQIEKINVFRSCKKSLQSQKTHLRATDGPENITNRKNIIFYIETIPHIFSELRKKIGKHFGRKKSEIFFDENFPRKKFQLFCQ